MSTKSIVYRNKISKIFIQTIIVYFFCIMKKLLAQIIILLILLSSHIYAQNACFGCNNPGSKCSVHGNLAIGQGYSVSSAPLNGAIIEGNVHVGSLNYTTTTPNLIRNDYRFSVFNGYASFGHYNTDPATGRTGPGTAWNGVGSLVIGMNRVGFASDVDFWNNTANFSPPLLGVATERGFRFWRYNNAGTAEMNIATLSGNGNLFVTGTYSSSDIRFKSNIKNWHEENILEKIMKVRIVSYNYLERLYINGELSAGDVIPKKEVGVIAQEFYQLFPQWVYKPANEQKENWAVAYEKMPIILIQAVQEQQKIIQTQSQKIEALEARLSKLEAKQ